MVFMDGLNTGCEAPSEFPEPSDAAVAAALSQINATATALHGDRMPPSDVRELIRAAEANAIGMRCSKEVALNMLVNEMHRRLVAAAEDLQASAIIAREYFADEARFLQEKAEAQVEARRAAFRVV